MTWNGIERRSSVRARRGWIGKTRDRFRSFVERHDRLRREIDRLEACIKLLEGASVDGGRISSGFPPALRSARNPNARDHRFDAKVIDWIAEDALASLKPAAMEDTERDSATEQVMAFASEGS
jgi:hypothetical protein